MSTERESFDELAAILNGDTTGSASSSGRMRFDEDQKTLRPEYDTATPHKGIKINKEDFKFAGWLRVGRIRG